MTDSPLKRLISLRREDQWLLAVVDAHLESSPLTRVDPGWFHPSDLSTTCDAYLAFSYLGVEGRGKISPRLQRIYDNGHARDRDIKKYFAEAGLSTIKDPAERFISIPDHRIRGEFDDIVKRPTADSLHLVEIKTMNNEQWKNLKEPLRSHVIQVQPYLAASGLNSVIFVYENKDTQEWKLFSRTMDLPLWMSITERLAKIRVGLRRYYVDRTPVSNDSQCPFYWMCSTADIKKLVEESDLVI